MKTLRAAIAGILSLAAVTAAFAQSAPANLAYHTVYGRLGAVPGDTGPGQAIPFATLLTQMSAVTTSRTISTTAPLVGGGDLSANRTLSITGVAGRVLAGAAPAFTATPTLGVAGTTVGTLSFENATSGGITLTPPTGALGTRNLTLPAATDTLVGKATIDILTNKTFDTAGAGNSFSINSLAATANTGTGAVVRAAGPTFTGTIAAAAANFSGGVSVASTSSQCLAVGTNGSTNPALNVDCGGASAVAGLNIAGAATGGTVAIAALDSGANTSLTINAKGNGTIGIGTASTGPIILTRATTLSNALTYGGVTLSNSATGTGSMALATAPTLSNPVVGTQAPGNNTTLAASTAFVQAAVVASTAGVASIAGNTGAFTLGYGLTNSVNDIRLSVTTITNSLSGNVALSNTASYFDGPSVAQGATGTWWASGTVVFTDASAARIQCKLWDGTTVISASDQTVGAGLIANVSLSGFLASPAGNLRISCKDVTTTAGSMLFNSTGTSKDSTISAHRLQ